MRSRRRERCCRASQRRSRSAPTPALSRFAHEGTRLADQRSRERRCAHLEAPGFKTTAGPCHALLDQYLTPVRFRSVDHCTLRGHRSSNQTFPYRAVRFQAMFHHARFLRCAKRTSANRATRLECVSQSAQGTCVRVACGVRYAFLPAVSTAGISSHEEIACPPTWLFSYHAPAPSGRQRARHADAAKGDASADEHGGEVVPTQESKAATDETASLNDHRPRHGARRQARRGTARNGRIETAYANGRRVA